MSFKKTLHVFLILTSSCFALQTFAAEPVAKEDTTPPAAEGALTADKIPPISNTNKPVTTIQAPRTSTQSAPSGLLVPAPGAPTPQSSMVPQQAPATLTPPPQIQPAQPPMPPQMAPAPMGPQQPPTSVNPGSLQVPTPAPASTTMEMPEAQIRQ